MSTKFMIGHKKQRDILYQSWIQNTIHHAWIFVGPKAIGKFSLARSFSQFLIESPTPYNAQLFNDSSDNIFPFIAYDNSTETPNIRILKPFSDSEAVEAKDITVDDIRKIQSYLQLTSLDGNWKIIIIDEATCLNKNASNALLKILEDPPEKTLFFLIAHNIGALPVTLRSRCQKLRFQPPNNTEISAFMDMHHPNLKDDERLALAMLAKGSYGKIQKYIELSAFEIYKKILEQIESDPEDIISKNFQFIDKFTQKKHHETYQLIQDLFKIIFSRFLHFVSCKQISIQTLPFETHVFDILSKKHNLKEWFKIFDEIDNIFIQEQQLHLEKKQTLLTVFSLLQGTDR